MAFLTTADLVGRLRGLIRPLDPEEAKIALDDELRGLMSEYTWSFSRPNLVLTTVAAKTTGTIAVTAGGSTVTGTGTSFVSPDDVGKFIRLPDANFYEVIAVAAGPQTLTLRPDSPYTGTTVTGAHYTLFQHRYALADGIERILTMGSPLGPIRETTQFDLDAVDPQRHVSGPPAQYAPIGENALGQSVIEIRPVPFIAYHLTYVGLRTGSLADVAGSQLITLLAEVLLEQAAARGALIVAGSGDAQAAGVWMKLSTMWQQKAMDRMTRVRRADRKRFGYPESQSGSFLDSWSSDPGLDTRVFGW